MSESLTLWLSASVSVLCGKPKGSRRVKSKSEPGCSGVISPASRTGIPCPRSKPLYLLFYDNEEPPQLENLPERKTADEIAWSSSPEEARFLSRMAKLLDRLSETDRRLLLHMAQRMAEH